MSSVDSASSPASPQAIAAPEGSKSRDPGHAQESLVQASGPCVYKDKCKGSGQTLYVCSKCSSRFHHLCAAAVGDSDDMNICRAGCDGTPTPRTMPATTTTPNSKTKPKKSQQQQPFARLPGGMDLTSLSDDSDDDEVLTQANKLQRVTKKGLSFGTTTPRRTIAGDDTAEIANRGDAKKRSKDKTGGGSRHPEDKPKDPKDSKESTDQPRDPKDLKGHEDKPKDHAIDSSGKSKGSKDQQNFTLISEDTDTDDKTASGRTTGGKQPKKVPRHKPRAPENVVPQRLAGGRPTVSPGAPNHREMVLPLFADEEVIYADPETDEPNLGYVVRTVESRDERVTVRPVGAADEEEIHDLTIEDFKVVKSTDHLIYCGVRYCVFGPPIGSFCSLGWGTAWLDLVGERAHYHEESVAHDKMLYELKRFDTVMLRYPGVPDCPVLVLGFLQNRTDDSDWKIIGVVNSDKTDILDREESAAQNICFMNPVDLKKDFETTATFIVTDTCDFYMVVHPSLKLYKKAMRWIGTWSKRNPAWTPQKSWKAKLNQLYAREFKAITGRAIHARPCQSCAGLQKQLEKSEVSLVFCFRTSEQTGNPMSFLWWADGGAQA